ncbi:MAG TPA: hypothetical protein VF708_07305 [Pyrinomonadaceae bacterium]|jgi:hypothetical protein
MMELRAALTPPNPFGLMDKLLMIFSRETANYVIRPFIQIGAVVTAVAAPEGGG